VTLASSRVSLNTVEVCSLARIDLIEGTSASWPVITGIGYVLVANFETLILTGTAAVSGIGNAANNTITGNSANNIIRGSGGRDVLTGAGGSDSFKYNAVADTGITAGTRDRITDFPQLADLIDLSAIDAGAMELKVSQVDVAEVP